MTASETRRIRGTASVETFMAFVACSPENRKDIFYREKKYHTSPHSIYIYSILCGLTPFF